VVGVLDGAGVALPNAPNAEGAAVPKALAAGLPNPDAVGVTAPNPVA